MIDPKILGKRIKFFRERAHLSQLELETSINASAGMISRIEKGRVNPTKETMQKIAAELKLTQKEKVSLFPTKEEITSAISEVNAYLERPGFLGYLVDDWWVLHAASNSLIAMLNLDPATMRKAIGKNLLEVYFDPSFGVIQNMDPDRLVNNFAIETARAKAELNPEYYGDYFETIVQKLISFPYTKEILKRVNEVEDNVEVVSAGLRVSHLIIKGQKITLNHAREKLKKNPRFELIELFNPQPYV